MTSVATTGSAVRAVATATLVASVLAVPANAMVSLAAQAAGADPTVVEGLAIYAYGTFTVIGVLAGAIGWAVIRTRASQPTRLLSWLVPTVVAVSLIPNVLMGVSTGWLGAGALGLMHVVVALVAVPVYRRFLPVTR